MRTYETHEEYFGTDIGLDIVNNEIEDATLHTPGSSPPHKRLCPTEMKTTSAEEKTTSNKSEVSGKDNWMKKGPKKGRGRGEQPQGSKCSIVARPEAEAKGHTGYLTFARRAV